ncbi:hypothetical protein PVAP13_1KG212110 [Panicum virgatum]|uniref:Uncharacterized protein n=1 Tax=Panicum virgatum TaxID=38727 RepID=A0A8T0XN24_PANVG|nr:hypothetical protein PVAP13_1KG212110 [Panicum virgatum]
MGGYMRTRPPLPICAGSCKSRRQPPPLPIEQRAEGRVDRPGRGGDRHHRTQRRRRKKKRLNRSSTCRARFIHGTCPYPVRDSIGIRKRAPNRHRSDSVFLLNLTQPTWTK